MKTMDEPEKGIMEEFDKRFNNDEFCQCDGWGCQDCSKKFKDFILSALAQQREKIVEEIRGMKESNKFPHQSLMFQGGCPKCGQEANSEFCDKVCLEIRNEALEEVIKKIENHESR